MVCVRSSCRSTSTAQQACPTVRLVEVGCANKAEQKVGLESRFLSQRPFEKRKVDFPDPTRLRSLVADYHLPRCCVGSAFDSTTFDLFAVGGDHKTWRMELGVLRGRETGYDGQILDPYKVAVSYVSESYLSRVALFCAVMGFGELYDFASVRASIARGSGLTGFDQGQQTTVRKQVAAASFVLTLQQGSGASFLAGVVVGYNECRE
ncbi:hypothetical protein LXG23DRAFT_38006 [Yarrowia lipolytica]|nr:hypothetical protein BKA91DRAFT_169295 [Yarrowia lipolytica]KAE8172893.1 hypothetical protein BKA90DRAFT_167906 [Yarrowia lipolytica]KAJ8051947.1 hypothetical protein LXG23DRAFT_38006 [Yarrowia lipolytica]RMJ00656.1 hypothetical protein BD777DRAFT_150025 [Yarrowia lipolytica]